MRRRSRPALLRLSRATLFAIVVVAVAIPVRAAEAAPADEARALAAEIVEADPYQQELPEIEVTPTRRDDRQGRAVPLGWLGWVILILLLLLVVTMILRSALDRRYVAEDGGDGEGGIAGEGDDRWARVGLERAERLASEGWYDEALHVLLLSALDELRRRSGVEIADSLTSREILARIAIPVDAIAPLDALVSAVELSHFGERPCERADYDRGRVHFDEVRDALTVKAAA